MPGVPLFVVDAFTTETFRGNPAAVVVLDSDPGDEWMQAVAAELGVSETAFVAELAGGFALRWFTPSSEVDLCGHATLATAHTLWETGLLSLDLPARFDTRSGTLTATRRPPLVELDLPADDPKRAETPAGLADALGAEHAAVHRARIGLVVELADADTVRTLEPDIGAIATLDVQGVVVTAPGDDDVDFVSRYFAPRVGISEDPVTGAAHCALGPYWGARLGRGELLAHQASARGGVLHVRPEGDRVAVAGPAVTVLTGELRAAR